MKLYEDRRFETILEEMLDSASDAVDKREGSILYDALAPAARKLAEAYAELGRQNLLGYAHTSSGDELRARGADFGVDPLPAESAVREGLFADAAGAPLDVAAGSLFGAGGLLFRVRARLAPGRWELVCESAGEQGNLPTGPLLPLEYVDGLATAVLGGVLKPGKDEEDDEAFRERFFAHVRTPPTSGNRAAFRSWALEIGGVGDAYVLPAWKGPNTVKILLLDKKKVPASADIVKAVKAYIDPAAGLGEGMGEGAAPAGAVVTVEAAPLVNVEITATISRTGTRSLAQIQADFAEAVRSHLADIAYGDDRSVKYARIGTLLLDTPGVLDYSSSSLMLNSGSANVAVPAGSVAALKAVTLRE
ncbi:baseplate J/gp47 family protein [Paenibacillus humicus]|uniref:baseplate J/gp47 family protein n=1 Tax=Paenibacillus humicus TaxID=412861 RepID=UPI003F149308